MRATSDRFIFSANGVELATIQDDTFPAGGVGMFVAPGARARLSESERSRFLTEEWPEIRARMRRLAIDPATLLDRERA